MDASVGRLSLIAHKKIVFYKGKQIAKTSEYGILKWYFDNSRSSLVRVVKSLRRVVIKSLAGGEKRGVHWLGVGVRVRLVRVALHHQWPSGAAVKAPGLSGLMLQNPRFESRWGSFG